MRMRKLLALGLLLGYVPLGHAADFHWNGFLSIAGGKTLDDGDALYLVDPLSGATYDDEVKFEPESIAGIQGQAVVSDNLRGTVQVVARGGKQFDAEIDWAYLSYDFSENLTLNAGRFRLPLFYYSDFIDVGYAYHWIRPPVEVYNVPHSALQGVNLRYSTLWGNTEFESQVWYGSDYVKLEGTPAFDVRNDMGATGTLTWEWLTLRAVVNSLDITLSDESFGTMEIDNSFASLALMLDFGDLFWRSEYTELKGELSSDLFPSYKTKDNTWYASVGYNFGNVTPHVTHAVLDGDPMGFTGQGSTDTYGISWAFHPSAKLKFEYLKTDRDATLMLPESESSVISTAIDFIF